MIAKIGGERGRRRKASKRWGKETDLFETQTHPVAGMHSVPEKGGASRA
jgi:hypothetical protein